MGEARGGLLELTAAVPDGFLMCSTHDPQLVSRLAASSPTLIVQPVETCMKTDKAKTQTVRHDRNLGDETHISMYCFLKPCEQINLVLCVKVPPDGINVFH